jgi:phospholipase C
MPSPIPLAPPLIENVVVLMMENHSFDNMLGWLPGVGELTGDESNTSSRSGRVHTTGEYPSPRFATNPCPKHDFADVTNQVFGAPLVSLVPDMSGFVDDFEGEGGRAGGVMGCYSPEQVPVMTALATNFTVCTRWFCSVPGPTGPNRIYANCATSSGYAGGGYQIPNLPSDWPGLTSTFGVLAKSGYNWGVYYEDPNFCTELVLTDVQSGVGGAAYLDKGFNSFHSQLQKGSLPSYSFLTPALFPNSQHSPQDIRYGECVMANIYEMIRNSSYWEKTLLIITYDEHGGFYDSIPTPTVGVLNPDGLNSDSPPFAFDRLGVRVPALLISPRVAAGVDATQYEHSSIPATVMKLFGLKWPDLPPPAPPGQRNQRIDNVNTFETAINNTLRTDLPRRLHRPPPDYIPLPEPLLPPLFFT